MEKNIGIWLDSDKAYIIEKDAGQITVVRSAVEHYHLHGGFVGASPYGEQDAISETTLDERKKHQLKGYFEAIMDLLVNTENIVVFGPGETKEAFLKAVKKNPLLEEKFCSIETADKLTENQMKEWVRKYYDSHK